MDDDADHEPQKNSDGSEPTSPAPPQLPRKPLRPHREIGSMVASVSDPNLPVIPPRSPPGQPPIPPKPSAPCTPPVVPPRTKSSKDKMLVQSVSWIGGLEGSPSPLHLDRHRSPSLDVGTPLVGHLSKKPPPRPIQHNSDRVPHQRSPPLADSMKAAPPHFAPTENGGHHKSPLPLPSTPSPDTPPTLQTTADEKMQQDHVATSLRGFGKNPAPPPPVTNSSGGDYPPYDKLAPIGGGEFPPYDRLKPITVLPLPPPQLPSKPSHMSSVPPLLPPRSTVDAQTLTEKDVRPPLPPKVPRN